MNRYSYEELRAKAIRFDASQEDLKALADWFEQYDTAEWNGEYYDADGYRLFPVYEEVTEDDFQIVGYEFR